MNWYKAASRFTQFMPCDRFRRQGPEYQQQWQEMMSNAQEIPMDEFLQYVDPSGLFDDPTDPVQDLTEEIADDQGSYFAKSSMNGQTVFFIGTKGYEYIFTQ